MVILLTIITIIVGSLFLMRVLKRKAATRNTGGIPNGPAPTGQPGPGTGAAAAGNNQQTPARTPRKKGCLWWVVVILVIATLAGAWWWSLGWAAEKAASPYAEKAVNHTWKCRIAFTTGRKSVLVNNANMVRYEVIGQRTVLVFEVFYDQRQCEDVQTCTFEFDSQKSNKGTFANSCPEDRGTWDFNQNDGRPGIFYGRFRSDTTGEEGYFELYRTS